MRTPRRPAQVACGTTVNFLWNGWHTIEQTIGSVPHPRDAPLDTSRIASIRMGTTVATNALLERQGERVALVVSRGFPDLLHIANQSRPNIFDLEIRTPDKLYEAVELVYSVLNTG
ncbi:5-oxoprolinase [Tetrabaena socialis]|uniref:5-oxoprolinase n=1 Tax=Tetrabaena socialis TaxID=47790 RepID=A0A2J8AA31_9CHLO|nr:5-oxoprolinase [Tetrabaena socialis]|eukprot:PNH09382.1 5-oxoprolinase [Tetrabaena socialis]